MFFCRVPVSGVVTLCWREVLECGVFNGCLIACFCGIHENDVKNRFQRVVQACSELVAVGRGISGGLRLRIASGPYGAASCAKVSCCYFYTYPCIVCIRYTALVADF